MNRQQETLAAIAAYAATGQVPTALRLAMAEGEPKASRWRVRTLRLREAGLLTTAPHGAEVALWPGQLTATRALIGAELLEAWLRCRDIPSPEDGWVDVDGETMRVVDGVALARDIGAEDWRLLRGGVTRGVVTGALGRWEVVRG